MGAYVETVVMYSMRVRDDASLDDLTEIVTQTIPERSGERMTLAHRLRQEREKKGMEKGVKGELIIETLISQLKKKLNIPYLPSDILVCLVTLSIERLRSIRDDIFTIDSLEDLEKYL